MFSCCWYMICIYIPKMKDNILMESGKNNKNRFIYISCSLSVCHYILIKNNEIRNSTMKA